MSALSLALRNLAELQALYESLEDDHVAKQRIKDRVQEAKDAVKALDKSA